MVNDPVFIELKEIQNFSFDYFMNGLLNEMDRVDDLIEHTGNDPSTMSESEKIHFVLK
jgi:hypothetical protein